MTWMAAAVAAALVALVPFVLLLRLKDRRGWPTWDEVLAGPHAEQHAWLERDTACQMNALRANLDVARESCQAGDRTEVARLLRAAAGLVARHAAALRARLLKWAELSRSLAALRPARPLRLGALRLSSLKALAAAHRLADAALVSSGERFRLRTSVLRVGLHLVAAAFRNAARRALGRTRSADHALRDAQDGEHDLATLNAAALHTLRALLVSWQTNRPRSDEESAT